MLSRPKAGVPAGTRGRLGGFLSRRTRTLPVRVAADRLEGPPERAKTLRKKGTVRLSGLAGQNADRPELRTHGLALPENDAFPAVVCRDGERSRWTFGATLPGYGRHRDATPQGGMIFRTERADQHVHHGSRKGKPLRKRIRLAGGRAIRLPCVRRRHGVSVGAHGFNFGLSAPQSNGCALSKSRHAAPPQLGRRSPLKTRATVSRLETEKRTEPVPSCEFKKRIHHENAD